MEDEELELFEAGEDDTVPVEVREEDMLVTREETAERELKEELTYDERAEEVPTDEDPPEEDLIDEELTEEELAGEGVVRESDAELAELVFAVDEDEVLVSVENVEDFPVVVVVVVAETDTERS